MILLFSVSIGTVLFLPISYTTTYETPVGISSVTSLQVTNYNYVTNYWTNALVPYAYFSVQFGSSENQLLTMLTILALSIIAALSFLILVRRAHATDIDEPAAVKAATTNDAEPLTTFEESRRAILLSKGLSEVQTADCSHGVNS
jgi:Sec-independent protein secretion pathway component TatC